MCVLDNVNVLGDYLNLDVLALHFIMKRQEIDGVPAGSPRLEMGK